VSVDPRILELLEILEERRASGEAICRQDVARLCLGCPELIDEVWKRYQELQGFTPPLATQDMRSTALPPEDPSLPKQAIAGESDQTITGPGCAPNWKDPTFPRIPGYEVQGQLGEGGCGIVYKAWQTRLNRPVALKMILPGKAGPDQLARGYAITAQGWWIHNAGAEPAGGLGGVSSAGGSLAP
jgi:hypothetical protein